MLTTMKIKHFYHQFTLIEVILYEQLKEGPKISTKTKKEIKENDDNMSEENQNINFHSLLNHLFIVQYKNASDFLHPTPIAIE